MLSLGSCMFYYPLLRIEHILHVYDGLSLFISVTTFIPI
jgi:hypothetical protein